VQPWRGDLYVVRVWSGFATDRLNADGTAPVPPDGTAPGSSSCRKVHDTLQAALDAALFVTGDSLEQRPVILLDADIDATR
jgi:hypothetical protein